MNFRAAYLFRGGSFIALSLKRPRIREVFFRLRNRQLSTFYMNI